MPFYTSNYKHFVAALTIKTKFLCKLQKVAWNFLSSFCAKKNYKNFEEMHKPTYNPAKGGPMQGFVI